MPAAFLALQLSEEEQQGTSISGCKPAETEPEETLSRSKNTTITHTEAQQSWGRIFDLQFKLVHGQEPFSFLEGVMSLSSIKKKPILTIHPHITDFKKATLHAHCPHFNPHFENPTLALLQLLVHIVYLLSLHFTRLRSTPLSSTEPTLWVKVRSDIQQHPRVRAESLRQLPKRGEIPQFTSNDVESWTLFSGSLGNTILQKTCTLTNYFLILLLNNHSLEKIWHFCCFLPKANFSVWQKVLQENYLALSPFLQFLEQNRRAKRVLGHARNIRYLFLMLC